MRDFNYDRLIEHEIEHVTWDLDFEAWIERRQFDRLTRRVNVWQRPSPSL